MPHADILKYTGLELLQRIIDGKCPAPPISFQLSFALTEVSEGRAVFRGVPSERHLNPLGSVHGGWAATLLDSALGCAVQTLLEKGEAYTTAEFKVNLTRPITPRTGEVVCEGKVVHKGRTLAVSEATLKDAGGKLLAFGTETCSIFPAANLAAR
ncbi:PaaI family thioesterase [Mesorhizobium sp. M8A.F.Ca.ET.023.01.1.1]|nr:PaaI family thioesterase [Mesorhizobium sp. M8A.F.Ca.ET.023.01.1.1]